MTSPSPASPTVGTLVSQDCIDSAPSVANTDRVRVHVVGDEDQRPGQGPAATPRPRRVIDRERSAERLSALAGEQRPRDHQVAGGIAYPQPAEVDEGAEPALDSQQTPPRHVSPDPYGRTMPYGGLEGCLPRCGHCCSVEYAVQGSDRLAGAAISVCGGDAAAKSMRPGKRPHVG